MEGNPARVARSAYIFYSAFGFLDELVLGAGLFWAVFFVLSFFLGGRIGGRCLCMCVFVAFRCISSPVIEFSGE